MNNNIDTNIDNNIRFKNLVLQYNELKIKYTDLRSDFDAIAKDYYKIKSEKLILERILIKYKQSKEK
jgi:hypothetical protein